MSATNLLLKALTNGEELTAFQIVNRFYVGSPQSARSLVSYLRKKGYAVYGNKRTNSKGITKTFYRLGTPTRAIVAAGYRYMAEHRNYRN